MHRRRYILRASLLQLLVAAGYLADTGVAQQWTFLDGPAYGGRMLAFDWSRARLVAFGLDGATWEMTDQRFLSRDVDGPSPSARTRGVMQFDFLHDHVLMFGGLDGSNAALGDTWTWDGVRWTQLTAGPQPPARADAACTYDILRNRVVLYGGQQPFVGQRADTWEHDGTQWQQRFPSTVPGPNSPVMAYDLIRQVAVMVTHTGIANAPVVTWEWDGVDWLQRSAVGPTANGNESMTFDIARARTVLFGGVGNQGNIWEWDGNVWQATAVPGAPSRLNPAVYYDPRTDRVSIVGGIDFRVSGVTVMQGSARTDLWEWDGSNLVQVRGDLRPESRYGHVFCEHRASGQLVLFGGVRQQAADDETWTFDGNVWTEQQPTLRPAARSVAASCYDNVAARTLVFGGNSMGLLQNDLWGFTGTDWQQLDAGTGPSARSEASIGYDPVRGVAVLFGGFAGPMYLSTSLRDDTWEWDGTAWTQPYVRNQPSPRGSSALAYDPARQRLVLFGGRVGPTAQDQLADTWEFDGPLQNWYPLQPSVSPPPLMQPSMHHEPGGFSLALVGTLSTAQGLQTEVWRHAQGNWALVDRRLHSHLGGPAAWDDRRRRIVCHKGTVTAEWSSSPASVTHLGPGCGSPVPELAVRARARIGEAGFGLETTGPATGPVVFALSDAPGQVPLGAGCTLWLGGSISAVLAVSNRFGQCEVRIPIPDQVHLRGVTLYSQAAVLDVLAPLGFRKTQSMRIVVGD